MKRKKIYLIIILVIPVFLFLLGYIGVKRYHFTPFEEIRGQNCEPLATMNVRGNNVECTCCLDRYWNPDRLHYNCTSQVHPFSLVIYDFFRGAWNTMGNRYVKQGPWMENYYNHKPKYRGYYYNGFKYGKFVYYNRDGSVEKTVYYHRD